jgi:hypothetical protein
MISETKQAIEAVGLSFILGLRTGDIPYVVKQWCAEHHGSEIEDGPIGLEETSSQGCLAAKRHFSWPEGWVG